jgi:hypothetical protein
VLLRAYTTGRIHLIDGQLHHIRCESQGVRSAISGTKETPRNFIRVPRGVQQELSSLLYTAPILQRPLCFH